MVLILASRKSKLIWSPPNTSIYNLLLNEIHNWASNKKETASYIKTRGIWKLEPKTTCLKLIYEEIESLNGSITIKETESVLEFKILLAKKN